MIKKSLWIKTSLDLITASVEMPTMKKYPTATLSHKFYPLVLPSS